MKKLCYAKNDRAYHTVRLVHKLLNSAKVRTDKEAISRLIYIRSYLAGATPGISGISDIPESVYHLLFEVHQSLMMKKDFVDAYGVLVQLLQKCASLNIDISYLLIESLNRGIGNYYES